jgi:transglutaminase-like putative cysteine protease
MIILKENQDLIDKRFQEIIDLSGAKKDEIIKGLRSCRGLEESFIKLLYISMPLSDLANYDFNLFLSFARHAAFLRENMTWCAKIPDDIFLNYVLHYRVNNENIEECRRVFYDLIRDRITGKSMTEAALEINYWCLEHMTYKSTDERTMSPLTALRSAYGRCGEESTFTVTALRSVGIPARQIYAPKWSHCDDNHAWVEVWCDGNWHYMGACEPEPVLDKGWFTGAASRAMIIRSKIFSSFTCGEEVISKDGQVTVLNDIKRYALSRQITVQIIDKNNAPVRDVQVNFEVLNYSEFSPIASVKTDEEGKARITLGLGSVNINAVKSGRFINRLVNTEKEDYILLHFDDAKTQDVFSRDFTMIAPKDNIKLISALNDQGATKERFEISNNIRKEKESKFYNEERTHENVLIKSRGNYHEIEKFLEGDGKYFSDKLEMLKALTDKDYLDISKDMLEKHFNNSIIYKDKYPKDVFYKHLMNPRIYYEQISDYREFILHYFSREEKEEFREKPQRIWEYICDNISEMPEREYNELFTLPAGVLQIKKCSVMSKNILFAAICRTIGIPARMNKEYLSIEYYSGGRFKRVSEENEGDKARLTLLSEGDTDWVYMQNWSLGVLHNGVFSTLNLADREWNEGKLALELPPRNYRIINSNRIPSGNILSREYSFILSEGQDKKLDISLHRARIADMLKNVKISDFKLTDLQGNKVMAGDILNGNKNIVIWLEEGKEPTEHVLNEMIMLKDIFNKISCRMIFILKNADFPSNIKVKETIEAIPDIKLYYDDSKYNASSIARRMYLNPDEMPLIIVTDNGLNVVYASSGYNVGIMDLIIKIIKSLLY